MKRETLYPLPLWVLATLGAPIALIALGVALMLANADALEFDKPNWWWLAAIGPLAGCVALWSVYRRRRALARFASPSLAPLLVQGFSPARQSARVGLLVCAILMVAAAIIGPRWGVFLEKHRVFGIDIVVALDVSRSMWAEDVTPNRLARAKRDIRQQLTERTIFGNTNRLGLIAFAGSTSLKAPLSTDLLSFRSKLSSVEIGSAPRGGTALAKAIYAATDLFVKSPDEATKVILVFTDGEDHDGDPIAAAQTAFQEHGIHTFTIGVGDPARIAGAQIPIHTGNKIKPLLHNGQIVFSKLDVPGLRQIARSGSGQYAAIRDFGRLVDAIAGMHRSELSTEERIRHKPRYQWFLAIALLLLALEGTIHERRRGETQTIKRVWQWETAE